MTNIFSLQISRDLRSRFAKCHFQQSTSSGKVLEDYGERKSARENAKTSIARKKELVEDEKIRVETLEYGNKPRTRLKAIRVSMCTGPSSHRAVAISLHFHLCFKTVVFIMGRRMYVWSLF